MIKDNDKVCLLKNGEIIVTKKFWDDLDCQRKNYFPLVDLLGGVLEVTYQPVYLPPTTMGSGSVSSFYLSGYFCQFLVGFIVKGKTNKKPRTAKIPYTYTTICREIETAKVLIANWVRVKAE